jgi:hypothetical protein
VAIGEAGHLTASTSVDGEWIRVDFAEPIDNAVIALSGTSVGGDPYALRIVDQDANGFSFVIEEWEYLDGPHPAVETINWLAVTPGVHTLPDGRIIEAGTTSADHTGATVTLSGAHAGAPVVLTSVMSENDSVTVDSDALNVTSGGFSVRLQEEEGQDGIHAAETVGWIAITAGGDAANGTATTGSATQAPATIGLGDVFADPVILVDAQTVNGGNPATEAISTSTTSSVDVFMREETSGDTETNHVSETVGVVAFNSGTIVCFTPGTLIETPFGPRPIDDLQAGDHVLTRDNGPQALRWISRTHVGAGRLTAEPNLAPVLIRAGALGPGMPARDMLVSPQHRFLLGGWRAELLFGQREVLVPARALVNDASVLVQTPADGVDYVHLLFDSHEIVLSDGTPSESLHAGQLDKGLMAEAAREELFALFPALRCFERDAGPTARRALTVREGRVLAAAGGSAII